MFSKTFAIAALVLATSLQVNAHAAVSPVLGLATDPVRSDVKRPNARTPCGRNVDIAGSLDTSTPVQAAADGTFTMTATNFNRFIDGSRKFSALVDTTATGDSMTGKVTMVQNGDAAPPQLGSEQVVASLPAGTTCTGGTSGDKCLVQFKSVSGFGNCVVVQQGSDAAAAAASSNSTVTATTAAASTATAATDATDAAGAASTPTKGAKGLAKLFQRHNVGGTRVARRFVQAVDMLESREFEDVEIMDLVGRDLWDLLMELE